MELMYLDRNLSGDVTFLVESQRIQAHRIVLAATSPTYKAQFNETNSNKDEIPVSNVSAAAFNVFLQFFYKEAVDLTMDNIETVLDLAKQSMVDEFVTSCLNFLWVAIKTGKNLCLAHRLATLYGSETIRLECEQRISRCTMYVFASADILRCDRDMLLQILKMDELNCKEKDVFAVCIAWAREQCKRINLDDEKPENLRTTLGDVIYQIRFSSFSAEEFADLHTSMDGFFTADEAVEILFMIGKLKGLKSQKFIQTARSPQSLKMFDERNTVWSLEIDRFVRMNEKQSLESVEIGRVKFYSNDPIKLYGIALGVRFNQADQDHFPEILDIQVRRYHHVHHSISMETKYKIFQSPTRHDETIIMFERPIGMITAFSCDFQLPVKQLNYELILQRSIQDDGVDFTFDSKWATRVFCDQTGGVGVLNSTYYGR